MKRSITTVFLIALVGILYGQDKKFKSETQTLSLDFTRAAPKMVWIEPSKDSVTINRKDFTFKLGINSGTEITKIETFLNGLPVSERGLTVAKEGDQNYDELIEKPILLNIGDNTIRIAVENKDGLKSESTIFIKVLEGSLASVMNRKDYALLFASDDYDEWSDLTNPINDAQTMAKELTDKYGFEVEVVTNATQDEIMLKLRDYAQKSYQDDDQLFIFFAGHGQYDDTFQEGYIVAKNSRKTDFAKSSYIAHSVLRNYIDNLPCKHIFLTMDVCFGGTFDPLIARANTRGEDDLYKDVTKEEFIERKLQFKTRQYLTSGGKTYVSDGIPGRHSPFTSKFLEGLRSSGGQDDILTIAELFKFLEKVNPEPRTGSFGRNEPGSDFIFVVKK